MSLVFQRDSKKKIMDLPKQWFSKIGLSLGKSKKFLSIKLPKWPQVNFSHISSDDDKNILREWISIVLYVAYNHVISLTKKSLRKKISICQKCLSAIFSLLQ